MNSKTFKSIWLKAIYTENELKERLKKKYNKLKEGDSSQFFINSKPMRISKINGEVKITKE